MPGERVAQRTRLVTVMATDALDRQIKPVLDPRMESTRTIDRHPATTRLAGKTGREVPELRHSDVSHVALSLERRLLAATLTDGTIRAWELDGGDEVLSVKHPPEVLKLVFRADGAMLATIGTDWRARLVDVDEASEPLTLDHLALDLAFSSEDRMLATGGDSVVLWGPDPT